jgi:hypothetical protein
MLSAEKRPDTHYLSKSEKEIAIEDYVDGVTAGARMRVENAETAIMQVQHDMGNAQK